MIDVGQLVFKTEPWKHQLDALSFAINRDAAMLAMRMGTGKSWVVVNTVVGRGHGRSLILCPASVMNVWPREFSRHAATPVNVLVLGKGTSQRKMSDADDWLARKTPAVVVINYESAWREPFGGWARKQKWDCVVLDESHRVKSPTGKASRWCDKLRPMAGQRLCLSGTMMPHSPLDVFAQYRFLDPNVFGKWYTKFRSRYAVINPMFPSQVRKWINQDEMAEKIATIAFRVGSDVLDLPPVIHEEIPVELCPKARRVYRELEQELISQIDDGVITVANALVKLLRLAQLTGGVVQTDDGERYVVDTSKEEALADLLTDLPTREPVVVFCRFRHDLATVAKVAAKLGRRYGELSGERHDLTDTATMPDDVDLMGVQVQSGGVGIDLTRASYVVYLSLSYSLGEYEQSVARCHRPGQNRTVRYYHLVSQNTVDQSVYAALRNRKEVVESVLSQLKSNQGAVA